jgi:predicted ATP-grasp superfamily ATP-dependent carboligase
MSLPSALPECIRETTQLFTESRLRSGTEILCRPGPGATTVPVRHNVARMALCVLLWRRAAQSPTKQYRGRTLPSTRSTPPIRVLVLDPWERPSLAVTRSLGRGEGFDVGVAGYARRRVAGPAAYSRHVRRFHRLADPAGPRSAFASSLTEVIQRDGYDVVIATSDLTLARLATIEVPVPVIPETGAAFRALTDKLALEALAASQGIAYPASRIVDAGTADAAVADLGLPIVLKSARSAVADDHRAVASKGATVCHTIDDLVRGAEELRRTGLDAIAQQRVPFVAKINAAIIGDGGRSIFRYAHRVLREAPPSGGIGVSLETIAVDDPDAAEALAILERLCAAVGYRGVAQAEYYRSGTDGRLYLIDVNPRFWGSTWFAERLGLRVVERAIACALGLPPPPIATYPIGRRFHAPGVVRWARQQKSIRAGMTELVRTVRPWDVTEIALSDPMPLAMRLFTARAKRDV